MDREWLPSEPTELMGAEMITLTGEDAWRLHDNLVWRSGGRPPGRRPSHRQCPTCAKSMQAHVYLNLRMEVEHCESCGGYWMDPEEL